MMMGAWTMLLLLLLAVVGFHAESVYYCEQSHQVVIHNTSGTIITREPEKGYYDNNMDCAWVIETPGEQDNIYLRIEESMLAWAPETANCIGHDYVEVLGGPVDTYVSDKYDNGDYYNNYDDRQEVLVSWCGSRQPHTLVSDSNTITIRFRSNDRNPAKYKYKGVKMYFEVVGRPSPYGGCPPEWLMGPDPVKGPYCYGIQQHEETWGKAQDYCSYNQANLASIESESENEFIISNLLSKMRPKRKVWIGLNDISEEGKYRWLNGSQLSFSPSWSDDPHVSNDFLNCVNLYPHQGAWHWKEESCADSDVQSLIKYYFLCKKLAAGKTPFYVIPAERPEKGEEGTLPPKAAIIGGVLALCLLLLAAGGAIYWKVTKSQTPETGDQLEHISLDGPVAADEPPHYSPPPSYNEAIAPRKTVVSAPMCV